MNVTHDADDVQNLNYNPDAVPLISLGDDDGNVDNDEVSKDSPSSRVSSEECFKRWSRPCNLEIRT